MGSPAPPPVVWNVAAVSGGGALFEGCWREEGSPAPVPLWCGMWVLEVMRSSGAEKREWAWEGLMFDNVVDFGR